MWNPLAGSRRICATCAPSMGQRRASKPQLAAAQWAEIMYLRDQRDRFNPALLEVAVTRILVPGLRGS